jgi:hypothetical protein
VTVKRFASERNHTTPLNVLRVSTSAQNGATIGNPFTGKPVDVNVVKPAPNDTLPLLLMNTEFCTLPNKSKLKSSGIAPTVSSSLREQGSPGLAGPLPCGPSAEKFTTVNVGSSGMQRLAVSPGRHGRGPPGGGGRAASFFCAKDIEASATPAATGRVNRVNVMSDYLDASRRVMSGEAGCERAVAGRGGLKQPLTAVNLRRRRESVNRASRIARERSAK